MKRYDAHCKTILLGKALGRRSLQETARPAIKSKVPTDPTTKRGWSSHKTRTISQRKASVSVAEKQPQTAAWFRHGLGSSQMKGSKIKLHRQTAMTPGQVHVKGGRRREQGALLVARCASSTCLDEAQKIAECGSSTRELSRAPCK